MIWPIRIVRVLSACVELLGVWLLLRTADIRSMVRINSLLGLVGPFIFITVSALGLAGSLGKVQPQKFLLILVGVVLVLWGTRP